MVFSGRSLSYRALMALFLGMALHVATPAIANTLPEIQQLMKQGQYPQALEKADAYLARNPRDAQGRFFKGLILTEMNRADEAIIIFTQLAEDYPDRPEPYNNLAVLYAQRKEYDRARTALEMAIRTHPAYAVAYENLGDVYARLASQAYGKALQLDSANANAQNKLALIHDLVGASAVSGTGGIPPAKGTLPATTTPPVVAKPPATVVAATPGPAATAKQPSAATSPVTSPAASSVSSSSVPGKSAAPVVAPPAKPVEPEQEIGKMLAAWSAAWARQDVKAYLAFYAPGFTPAKGMNRKDWEAERRERIRRPTWIKVSYNVPRIVVEGNQATVRFRQRYQASNFKGDSDKTLVLTHTGNAWRILSEDAR